MNRLRKTLLMSFLLLALSAAALAQQVTSEAIGSLTGALLVSQPGEPIFPPDTVTFSGNVHVLAIVDLATHTADIHINLMSVKGIGANGKYVANGAHSQPGEPYSPGNPVVVDFAADLFPPGQFRQGFPKEGALPLRVTILFGEDGTISTVTAQVVSNF
jgi:hypothetical protein